MKKRALARFLLISFESCEDALGKTDWAWGW